MWNEIGLDAWATSPPGPAGMARVGGGILVVTAISGGCLPPVTPNPSLLGCYRLETELPGSYSDSLGYEIPEVIHLGYSAHGQWTVIPTDGEWHPDWTVYDDLPSGYVRRASGWTWPMQGDSVRRIPGDSIDIRFPSAIGQLVLRLGESGEGLGGRAEWVAGGGYYYLNEGARVAASRTSCEELRPALRRTRYR